MRARSPLVALLTVLPLVLPASAALAEHPSTVGSGTITGVVTGPDGAPVGEICVEAWFDDGHNWGSGWGFTDTDGTFTMTELNAGEYVVQFNDCAEARRFPSEYYEDALTIEEATPVLVGDKHATHIAAVLDAGASLGGTLLDDEGSPAVNVCVEAETTDGDRAAWTTSDTDGSYAIGGLRAGDLVVAFAACSAPIAVILMPVSQPGPSPASPPPPQPEPAGWRYGYVAEYYDEAVTRDAATPVPLTAGSVVTGIDAVLDRASALEMTLVDEDGAAADGVCVRTETVDGPSKRYGYADSGHATVAGLRPGEHVVHLEDCSYDGLWKSQWFDGVASRADATVLDVPPLGALEITATMESLPAPDLTIPELSVAPVNLQTDAAEVPGPGTQRDVRVTVANEGDAGAQNAAILVTARPRSGSDRSRLILADTYRLEAGGSRTFTERFDATGMAGDIRITAEVCSFPERDRADNVARADSYAVVGGTGAGIDTRDSLPFTSNPGWYSCENMLW